jgi:hypothetical protein
MGVQQLNENRERLMSAKEDFETAYLKPDPFAYYQAYAPTRLSIVEYPAALVRAARSFGLADGPVIDMGCGYGTLGALLRTERDIEAVYKAYLAGEVVESETAKPEIVGVDHSPQALASAERSGLIDDGLALDLNSGPPEFPGNMNLEGSIGVCCAVLGYVQPRALRAAFDLIRPRIAFVTCVTWLADEFCDAFVGSLFNVTEISRAPLFQRWATPGEKVRMPGALVQDAHRANCYVLSRGHPPIDVLTDCVEDLRRRRAASTWLAAEWLSAELQVPEVAN